MTAYDRVGRRPRGAKVTAVMAPAEEIAERVRGAAPRAGATRVLALDGPSGSGKTTLADAVAARLSRDGAPAPVVHLDSLYPGWDGLEASVPLLVRWLLEPLAAGRPGGYHRWDWVAGREAEWCAVPAADVVVVEGAGCGSKACAPYLSLLVWLDAPEKVRFARAMARDGETYRPHWRRWADQEERLFARERTRERADLVYDDDTV